MTPTRLLLLNLELDVDDDSCEWRIGLEKSKLIGSASFVPLRDVPFASILIPSLTSLNFFEFDLFGI